MPSLTFLGASGTVTGSKYLLEEDGKRLLVDCGLFQGTSETRQANWRPLPVDARSIDAVLLTHAHIDHTGYLPRLVRQGFEGPVYCTAPTRALLGYLLPDAGRLQEEEAGFANRMGYSRHRPALPLFEEQDANRALRLLRDVAFDETSTAIPGVRFAFHRVGHILGAGFIRLEAGGTSILFSGDVGRQGIPILKDPEPILPADHVLLESTYGDRDHGKEMPLEALERVVSETVSRRGLLLIPAFAVGRTQEILYDLNQLRREKKIPADLPVFVDSPMAVSVVGLYCEFTSEHDLETRELEDAHACPIEGPAVRLVRSVEESKKLNSRKGPAIILSASGMLSGGRILHHLKYRLPDPDTTLLFVGYQAEGTLGRKILEGSRVARIHGQDVPVRARIEEIPALSAHADRTELLEWFSRIPEPPRTTYLVHGEEPARRALAKQIADELHFEVRRPELGDREELS
jgi:metallo-beta-lactamase family protein